MKKSATIFSLIFIFSSLSLVFAQEVPQDIAKKYADNFMQIYAAKAIESSTILPFQKDETVYTYVVNYQPEGWVLLSGDERAEPVIAYSRTGQFDVEKIKDLPFYFWFEEYKNQIREITLSGNIERNPNWSLQQNSLKSSQADVVAPLIQVKWNQGAGWNMYCPADEAGPGGYAYAGCVAVAMGQNMHFHQYPWVGEGSKTISTSYGPLTANFGETQYRWDLTQPNTANEHTALILYHLGVSVDMGYDASGSGTFSHLVPVAISKHFDYTSKAKIVSRNNYSETAWANLLIEELKAGRPIYYAGNPGTGEAGHAFNLDGTDGSNRFHFNWGWSGQYDGYYFLTSLKPGSNDFSINQQAILNFRPRIHEPLDIYLSSASVHEALPVGTVVGTLSAEDETPNDIHTYTVYGPESIFGFPIVVPFTIDENKLITTEILDYTHRKRHEIIVEVTDLLGNTFTKNFFIDVKEKTDVSTSVNDFSNISNSFMVRPSGNQISFSLSDDYYGTFTMSLFEITGRMIVSQQFVKNSFDYNNTFSFNSFIPKGIYLISLDFPNNARITRKLFIDN